MEGGGAEEGGGKRSRRRMREEGGGGEEEEEEGGVTRRRTKGKWVKYLLARAPRFFCLVFLEAEVATLSSLV